MLTPVVAHDGCGVWESTDVVLLRLTDVPEDMRPFQTGGAHPRLRPELSSHSLEQHGNWRERG